MMARRIVLLLVILGFGSVIETAWAIKNHGGSISLGPNGCRGLEGRAHHFEVVRSVVIPAGTSLAVENGFGAVHVIVGEPGSARITLRKVVYEDDEAKARSFADQILIVQSLEAGTLRVGTNRAALDTHAGFETHLDVAVPPLTAVKVTNEHGRIEVVDAASADLSGSFDDLVLRRVAGAAVVANRHGDITVDDVKGGLGVTARYGDATLQNAAQNVTLSIEHGDATLRDIGGLSVTGAHGSLDARRVKGDLQVRAEHTAVEAADVSGTADVETTYKDVKLSAVAGNVRVKTLHGAIDASDLKGGVRAEASYDDVTLTRVAGLAEITVEHGSASATGLRGGATIRASGDDVTLEDFAGPVDIQAEHANVRLTPGAPLGQTLRASTSYGGIELELAAHSRCELQATARGGEVELDVPGLQVLQSDPRSVTARLGEGGSTVSLTADHGDVDVKGPGVVADATGAKGSDSSR